MTKDNVLLNLIFDYLTEECSTDVSLVQSLRDVHQVPNDTWKPNVSLSTLFESGLTTLNVTRPIDTTSTDSSIENDPVIVANGLKWKKWLLKLEKKDYFKDVLVGSEEYSNRMSKALEKFKQKFSNENEDNEDNENENEKVILSVEERHRQAEEAKTMGNVEMTAMRYPTAIEYYEKATLLSRNGPNSHIYFSNLAAAQTHLEQYEEVIANCDVAIQLKESYAKAYSRKGYALMCLQDYDGAVETYQQGVQVDGSNTACKEGLAQAKEKQGATTTRAQPGGMPAGMPDMSNLAAMMGGAGGAGGLAGLMNNPALAGMMQNPAMMEMAQNMMQNPDMMANLMQSMGGGGGAPGGGGAAPSAPDVSSMFSPEQLQGLLQNPRVQALKSDPEMSEFFADVASDGVNGAMRHINNPSVSSKLMGAISGSS